MSSFLLFLLLSSAFFICIGSPVLAGRKILGLKCDSSDVNCEQDVGSLKKQLLRELDSAENDNTEVTGTEETDIDDAFKKFLRVDAEDSESNKDSDSDEVKPIPTKSSEDVLASNGDVIKTSLPDPATKTEEVIPEPPQGSESNDEVTIIDDTKQNDGIEKDENDASASQSKNDDQSNNESNQNMDNTVKDKTANDEANNTQGMVAPQPQAMKAEAGKNENIQGKDFENANEMDDIYFIAIVVGCSVAGVAGLMLAGYCWYKLHNTQKQVNESEYKGSGSRRKSPSSINKAPGDEKLDYNAEMYHYQHTKNQISAMEKAKAKTMKGESLEDEDEDDDVGDEGEDDTVYECPGLAPAADMTVMNPLFSDPEAHASDDTYSAQSSPQTPRSQSKH